MNFPMSKPHYHSPLAINNDLGESDCLDSHEEYLKRELEAYVLKFNSMEKSMKWWTDCTSNWREKWCKMKLERNKLLDELAKSQELVKQKENENKVLTETVKRFQFEAEKSNNSNVECSSEACVENKIICLQEEVKRLSNLLGEARTELSKISEMSNNKLCKKCQAKVDEELNTSMQSEFSPSSSSEGVEFLRSNTEVGGINSISGATFSENPQNLKWKKISHSGSANASSLCVHMGGCSRSSTMDQLSQKDDPFEGDVKFMGSAFDANYSDKLAEEMRTLSRQIEKLPSYSTDKEF